MAYSLLGLGAQARQLGDYPRAQTALAEALTLFGEMGYKAGIAPTLAELGRLDLTGGEQVSARSRYKEALALAGESGAHALLPALLEGLASVTRRGGDAAAACRLLGAATALRDSLGVPRAPRETPDYEAELAATREALGVEAFARSWAEGEAMSAPQATEYAMAIARGEPVAENAAPMEASLFRRDGEYWTLSRQGHEVRLKDSRGLRYMAYLIARPGREFHVLDVIDAVEGTAVPTPVGRLREPELRAGPGDAGEVIDRGARTAYRSRIEDLRSEIEEAEAWGDSARAARLKQELDFLLQQLAAGVGLGGRARKAVSDADRARWAVAKAVRRSVDRIAAEHPELAGHLRACIKTGTFCSYEPDRPVAWSL